VLSIFQNLQTEHKLWSMVSFQYYDLTTPFQYCIPYQSSGDLLGSSVCWALGTVTSTQQVANYCTIAAMPAINLIQCYLLLFQWMNPRTLVTMDTKEKIHVIDVRSEEELEVWKYRHFGCYIEICFMYYILWLILWNNILWRC